MKAYDEKEIIAVVIKKFIKSEVNKDFINLRDTVLTVRVSGAQKQEIIMKSKEIQRLLQGAGINVTEIK
jgi:hypothetical protein